MHRNIRLLTIFNFFTDFKFYSAIAILYFAQVSGSYALGMAVFGINSIATALLEIPTGIFSDKIGRKKTIVCGAITSIVYSILYALAYSFGGFWMLAIGAIVEGIARSLYSGNNNAFLHDTLAETGHEKDFSEHLGKVSSMYQLALAISAILGSFIAEWSFGVIMWLSVIPQAVCFFIAIQMKDPKVDEELTDKHPFEHLKEAIVLFMKNPKLRLLGLSNMWSYAFGEAAFQFQAAFYKTLLPVWALGIAKMVSFATATIGFHYAGRVIRKFGEVPILLTGTIINRLLIGGAVLLNQFFSPFIIGGTGFFYGTGTVAQESLFQKEFKPRQRATMGSLASFGGSILFGIISVLLGMFADAVDVRWAYFGMQILMLPLLWWQWKLVGK